MGKLAFIFPGQGAQYIGMGKDFYETFESSKSIFDKATDILGLNIKEICFEENNRLNITEYTQVAMLTTEVAILKVVFEKGINPDIVAGLSLGEYSALVASQVLKFEDAIKVVRRRGILMQEAVPQGGAMVAVLGLEQNIIEKICEETEGIVAIPNYNCPGQIVISGEENSVTKAMESLKEAGAKRVVTLNVSGPFHSLMLKEAGEKLLQVLDKVEIRNPIIPYVSNTTVDIVKDNRVVKELLGKQVYSSVKWQQSIEKMIAEGVDLFIEIGPGKTLSSFIKKIDKTVKVINIQQVEDLEKLDKI